MFPHREHARERLDVWSARMADRVHPETAPFATLELAGPVDRIPHAEAQALAYRPAVLGEELGPLFATYWLRCAGTVPAAWAGSRVDVALQTGGEATLWLDGRPAQGLNSGPRMVRPDAQLLATAQGGETVELELELACNDLFGFGEAGQARERTFALRRVELVRVDTEAWTAFHDFDVLRRLERAPGVDADWAGELLVQLHAYTLDEDPERLRALYGHAAAGVHELSAIGHAHLDTAWLWPLAETRRKLVRTVTTQLRLLDAYPEHVFCHSQAQHYAWLRDLHPELYARVREQIEAGRWIPVGGSWVEPDCNLPSGESLARQFLLGQRFFEAELGRRATEFWQPDVFGYTAQLPQLMREAGMTRFLTQKLSWNRFNTPEHHTFHWEGLDGSQVLAHFPPADTYNAEATVQELRASVSAYRDHGRSHESLLVFGHGDGGGGPTPEMLETLARSGDLLGLPRTAIRSPELFFDRLEADARDLRTVVGELYFEFHRGTYTSQAKLKQGNRRAERALADAELLVTALARVSGDAAPAAVQERLERAWERLLLNQFHDILPGTSITQVNVEARADLGWVREEAEAVVAEALAGLGADGVAGRTAGSEGGGAAAAGAGPLPVNTLGRARMEVTERPDGGLVVVDVPACGVGALIADDAFAPVTVERTPEGGATLANGILRAEIGPDGSLRSLVHLPSDREALAGGGNRLELADDDPARWDAWDLDPVHLETRTDVAPADGLAAVREAALRGEVDVERAIGDASTLRQTIRLDAGAQRLEFHTEVDWQEEHKVLRAAFGLAVRATEATYEVAFGAVRRPTHYSTRADLARFEVPGHRWADMGEHGFGVALLTDSTYGYSALGDTLRLTLLRAPRLPDPEADRGLHRFAYAVLPHAGGWEDAGVVGAAHAFNTPLRWARGLQPGSWAQIDAGAEGLVLDTVKPACDGAATVLRLYESCGGRGAATVRVAPGARRAWRANLLEDRGAELPVSPAGAITVPYRPWEILTVVVE